MARFRMLGAGIGLALSAGNKGRRRHVRHAGGCGAGPGFVRQELRPRPERSPNSRLAAPANLSGGLVAPLHLDRDPSSPLHPCCAPQPPLLDVGRGNGGQRARSGDRQRGRLHSRAPTQKPGSPEWTCCGSRSSGPATPNRQRTPSSACWRRTGKAVAAAMSTETSPITTAFSSPIRREPSCWRPPVGLGRPRTSGGCEASRTCCRSRGSPSGMAIA